MDITLFHQLAFPSLKMIRFESREVTTVPKGTKRTACVLGSSISSFSTLRFVLSLLQVFSFVPFHFSPSCDSSGRSCWYIKRASRRFPRRRHIFSYLRVLKLVISRCRKFIAVDRFPTTPVLGVLRCAENRTLHSFLDSRTMFALSLMALFPYKVSKERIKFQIQSLGYIKKNSFIPCNPRRNYVFRRKYYISRFALTIDD